MWTGFKIIAESRPFPVPPTAITSISVGINPASDAIILISTPTLTPWENKT